jgi:hypothetical protein
MRRIAGNKTTGKMRNKTELGGKHRSKERRIGDEGGERGKKCTRNEEIR